MTSTPISNGTSNGYGNTPTRSRVLHSFHFEDVIRYVFEDDTHSPEEGTAVDRFVQESIETNCAKWTKEDRDKPFKGKIENIILPFKQFTKEHVEVLESMSRRCGRRLRVLWLDVESLKRDFRNERDGVFRLGEYSIIPRFLERSILRLRVVFLGACALLLESKVVEKILQERPTTTTSEEYEKDTTRNRSNSIRDAAVKSARRRSKSTTEINFQTFIRKHERIEQTRNELNET